MADMQKIIPEKKKRITAKKPVRVIVNREFVGTQTIPEAFIPIIYEDIRKSAAKADTLDTEDFIA